jgi:protein-tyrosine phosphatase
MGKRLNEAEARALLAKGITAVLDLTSEFSEVAALRSLPYLNVPILDLTAPTEEQLRAGVEFIGKQAQGGGVYVHCKTGYSRSAAFVGAHLIATGAVGSAGEAITRMRSVRPSIVIRPEIVTVLTLFQTINKPNEQVGDQCTDGNG